MTSSLPYDIIRHIESFVQKKDCECYSPTAIIMKQFINNANSEYLAELKYNINELIFLNLDYIEIIKNIHHSNYHHQLQNRILINHKRINRMTYKFNLLKILKNNIAVYLKRKYIKKKPPIGYFYM